MAKLLIVDDSTMLRDMLNYALNEGGYTDVIEFGGIIDYSGEIEKGRQ